MRMIRGVSQATAALSILLFLFPGAGFAVEPAGKLPRGEVKRLVATAKTAQDHTRLAAHYQAVAEQHAAEAKSHEALAARYLRNPTIHETKHPMSPETYAHCKYFAEHCRKAAEKMRAKAAEHESMAREATNL